MNALARSVVPACLALALAGCGDDDGTSAPDASLDAPAADASRSDAALSRDGAGAEDGAAATDARPVRDGAATDDATTPADAGPPELDASAPTEDSGARDASAADGDAEGRDTGVVADAGPTDAGPRCALEGTWRLVEIRCDDMDITADWRMVIESSVVRITTGAAARCHIAATHASAMCREVQEIDEQADGTWLSLGITSCEPPGCRFAPDDAPCTPGDRAGIQRPAVERTGDRFTTTWMPGDSGGFCDRFGMTTRETWMLE